jgi:prepilin-type N-terminal cleavage/methylation domain-containing protein
MKRFSSLSAGFTLTESVVAITLCALVLAGAYPLLTSTTRKLYQARDHYAATTICMAQIERARDIPYEQLATALGRDNRVRVNEMGAIDPTGRFRRTTSVAENSPDPGVTAVTVVTDIMDRQTGTFLVENESMSYVFTEYLQPMDDAP